VWGLWAAIALSALPGAAGAADPAAGPPPGTDVAQVASATFLGGCLAHWGEPERLRARLRPGGDLFLPRLPGEAARPYLLGRPGDVYARPDAGVALALFEDDASCAVFVQTVERAALFARLKADLAASLGASFTIAAAGEERKGVVGARFLDVTPAGAYRDELARRLGHPPSGWRVALTGADAGGANPNLQAILTLSEKAAP